MEKEYYEYTKLPLNEVVWGYAYDADTTSKTVTLKKEPVQGIIVKNDSTRLRSWRDDYFFYELSKDGKPKKSSKVRARNREYAFTKDEAIELYNERINCNARKFLDLAVFHKGNLIEMKGE